MKSIGKRRLKALDFHYIEQVHGDLYKVVYAKDVAAEGVKNAYLVTDKNVCFMHKDCCDHGLSIPFASILCK